VDVSPHVHEAKRLRGESSTGRNVYGANRPCGVRLVWTFSMNVSPHVHGTKRPWSETLANCQWGEGEGGIDREFVTSAKKFANFNKFSEIKKFVQIFIKCPSVWLPQIPGYPYPGNFLLPDG